MKASPAPRKQARRARGPSTPPALPARRRRALLSVADKRGLAGFARALASIGFELVATEGTARALAREGVSTTPLSRFTAFSELAGGRVKTLDARVFAGILADRGDPGHLRDLERCRAPLFDIVVCNLYPFEQVAARPRAPLARAVENIDIGGVALLRAAAKNASHVLAVTDPDDYKAVAAALRHGRGLRALARRLAAKAFARTAAYDAAIAGFLCKRWGQDPFPEAFALAGRRVARPRYGENPSQQAAAYARGPAGLLGKARQLHGKPLSYNNYLDAHAALACVRDLAGAAAVIVKHNTPCGAARAPSLAVAFRRALAADPVSAFGGVIALSRRCDEKTARAIAAFFNEVVLAPAYTRRALALLTAKPSRRVLVYDPAALAPETEVRTVFGGFLVQEPDTALDERGLACATRKKPSPAQRRDLLFAARVARHVRSNAIVLAKNQAVVGVGAGQPSRVDAVKLALAKAGKRARGAVLASDAFFPFPDGLEEAARAGVKAFLAPSGSVRDREVVAAADRHRVALLFSRHRHFRH